MSCPVHGPGCYGIPEECAWIAWHQGQAEPEQPEAGDDRSASVSAAALLEALRLELAALEQVAEWHRRAEQGWADERARVAELTKALAGLKALAKSANSQAAAPDYDEEAIRDALWSLVRAVLAAGELPAATSEGAA